MCRKKKLKNFENYQNCFEAIQLDNKVKYLEKNKINIDSLRNNKLILKTQ